MDTNGQPGWSDDYWLEKSDGPWRRRLRRHQGWWRATNTKHHAGEIPRRDRPVVSMLPKGVDFEPNLLSKEAVASAHRTLDRLRSLGGPGLVNEDRLRRNLLSSQPLCFNLFGHLRSEPMSLLPWVRNLVPSAEQVTCIELEIAPAKQPLGRSAFDAFVVFKRADGRPGFLGIECKYAENLAEGSRKAAAQKFVDATVPSLWRNGAAKALDKPRLRQFWFNTLLMQQVESDGEYGDGISVVVACGDDVKAREATEEVRAQLKNPDTLVFSALEDVIAAVDGESQWKQDFTTRYLHFQLSK